MTQFLSFRHLDLSRCPLLDTSLQPEIIQGLRNIYVDSPKDQEKYQRLGNNQGNSIIQYIYIYIYIYNTIYMYSGITSGRVLNGELLYTKISTKFRIWMNTFT